MSKETNIEKLLKTAKALEESIAKEVKPKPVEKRGR
jgi:hypothetical protein